MSEDAASIAHRPLLSLIIPTRNRPEQLGRCLASLAGQTYQRDRWEVIVIIDGEDNPDIDAAWAGRLPLRCSRQPHSGCGIARNSGAALARGRYLVFTDDDCLFPPDWLLGFAEQFERAGDCVIAGRSVNALRDNVYSEATQEMTDYLLLRYNSPAERAMLAFGNNFGVPAGEFRALGGFSRDYFRMAAEDRDFCARWLAQGRRIVYAPGIIVYHAHQLTLASFLRQHFRYGRGARLLHTLEAQRRSTHFKIEAPGFYLALLLWPWKNRKGFSAARTSALLLISQAAHTVGYLCGFLAGPRTDAPAGSVKNAF